MKHNWARPSGSVSVSIVFFVICVVIFIGFCVHNQNRDTAAKRDCTQRGGHVEPVRGAWTTGCSGESAKQWICIGATQ